MPKKNKGAQEGRPAAPEGASWNMHEAIWNAKSLQRVVENLERTRPESPESALLLFNGSRESAPAQSVAPRTQSFSPTQNQQLRSEFLERALAGPILLPSVPTSARLLPDR